MADTTQTSPSLYDRLGGEPTIKLLVSKFYERILKDPELAPFFKHTSMKNLHHMQTEFLRAALDGPPTYTQLSIVKAHQGRGISLKHFNKFSQHVLEALKELSVNPQEIEAVIARINLLATEVTGNSTSLG